MKTSTWWFVFFFVLGGLAMVAAQNMLFVKATAQQPNEIPAGPPIQANQFDGRVVTELRADGVVVQRTPDGRTWQTQQGNSLVQPGGVAYPFTSPSGNTLYVTGSAPDPETARLMNEELQATQAAHKVIAELRAAESEGDKEKLKTQLRANLVAIFDLQQKRRATEVTKIEERLAKLKDTMKKRESSKEAIVDRRLDVLTGGVDELGWEETFPLGAPNTSRTPNYPRYGPPTLETPPLVVPPPTAPRANVPVLPVPSLPGAAPAPPADPAAAPSATTIAPPGIRPVVPTPAR
jgi:hypothetical protein